MQQHVDVLFPHGVTQHGETYVLRGKKPANSVSAVIELLFEYVRRSHYHERPSRFESLFAWKTLEDAHWFAKKFTSSKSVKPPAIWEVEANSCFTADMSLLTLDSSLLVLSYNAHRYWKGRPGPTPRWEVLLEPPVTVVRQMTLDKGCAQ